MLIKNHILNLTGFVRHNFNLFCFIINPIFQYNGLVSGCSYFFSVTVHIHALTCLNSGCDSDIINTKPVENINVCAIQKAIITAVYKINNRFFLGNGLFLVFRSASTSEIPCMESF